MNKCYHDAHHLQIKANMTVNQPQKGNRVFGASITQQFGQNIVALDVRQQLGHTIRNSSRVRFMVLRPVI